MPSKDEAMELLKKAGEETRLIERGSPPLHIRAKTKSFGSKHGVLEGIDDYWWISPEQWREDITWGGATSARIVDRDRIWIAGEDTHRLETHRLSTQMHFWQLLGVTPQSRIKSVHHKEINGVGATCLEVREETQRNLPITSSGSIFLGTFNLLPDWTVCLYQATGHPMSVASGLMRMEFGAFNEFGGKYFPRTMRLLVDGKLLIEVELDAMEAITPSQANVLTPPQGASSMPWCSNMILPRPLHLGGAPPRPRDFFPTIEAFPLPPDFGSLGFVVFDVDDQGHVNDVKAYDRGGLIPIKDSMKRELLRSTFKPATCQGKAIPAEFEIGPPPHT